MKREPELRFLNEVSAVPLQQALRHQEQPLRAFLEKRARYPRYKSRHGRQSATRVHAKIADARRDFLHKTSTRLIRRFDTIAIEDLNVAAMVRNRRLARAISCTG